MFTVDFVTCSLQETYEQKRSEHLKEMQAREERMRQMFVQKVQLYEYYDVSGRVSNGRISLWKWALKYFQVCLLSLHVECHKMTTFIVCITDMYKTPSRRRFVIFVCHSEESTDSSVNFNVTRQVVFGKASKSYLCIFVFIFLFVKQPAKLGQYLHGKDLGVQRALVPVIIITN